MADYKTALNMEEEAMQSMKRSQTLKDTKHGICNPMVSHNEDKFAAKRQQIKSTGGIPDLMSFNEASKQGSINDWLAFEQSTSTTASNTQYNATIKNVMSLYDSNQAANQPFHPSVWKSPSHSSSTFLPRRSSSPFAPATPQKAPATFGYPSQGSHNFSQHATQNSTAFSNLTAFAHSRSSLSGHSSLHSAHVPLSKNLSHPASLNLFGQEPFSQTRASQRNKSPMAGSPMRKNASWKQFEDGNNFNNAGHSPTNVNPKSDINFDEAFQKPNSRTSSVKTNTSSGSGGGSADPMDNIFMDWFNDQLIKGDATQSPKQEVFAILPPKPPPTWVDLDPLAQSENLNFAEDMPDGIGDSTAMQNWKCENASGLQDNQNDDCVPQATQEKQISKESTILVGYDSELDHFCRVIEDLRSRFKHVDPISNPGHVVGHIMSQNQWMDEKGAQIIHEDIESTVRVSIITEGNSQPVTFECDVNASIEHIVSQALCIAYEDISLVSADDYTFKVVGRQEYLLSKSQLSAYRYVQECCKYERDVDLELVHHSKVDCSLKRTSVDDGKQNLKTDFREVLEKPNTIMTRENILVLWEAFYKEEETLMKDLEMDSSGTTPLQHQCERVIQSVKAMCCALGGIESVETTEAVKRLRAAINRPTTSPAKSPAIPVVKDLVGISSTTDAKSPFSPRHKKTQDAIDHLTKVLQDFVELYCQSHESDFYSEDSSPSKPIKVNAIPSTAVKDLYSVCIVSAHRIPKTWETTYEEFFTVCSLWHGQQRISHKLIQTPTTKPLKGFYQRLIWEKWLDFDVAVHDLPLEIVLKISIYGSTPSEEKSSPKCLVQINTPLFDTNRILKHGSHIFGMWDMATVPKAEGERHVIYHCFDDVINTESVVIHVNFSEEKWPTRVVKFPEIVGAGNNGKLPKRRHSDMLTDKQQELIKTLGKAKRMVGSLCNLSEKEKEILWQNRSVVAAPDGDEAPDLSLPLLLRCVPSWSPTAFHARDAYDLLAAWPQRPQPEESLALLTSGFPDSRVRSAAVRWLEGAGDMDIGSWMPQLVQALKWEQRHDSPLMKLVLRRAMGSIRIAQKLFWLLQENMDDLTAGGRYKALHAALMVTCGSALKKEFEKELYFLKMIHRVAEAVRDAKDSAKAALLQEDLNKVSSRIGGHRFRDPLNPAHVVNGVNVKNSSHFTSNAVPIKVAFTNSDPTGSEINVMYKVGDDLRQDALTMQLIRVMDRMWLAEGLDLKIITFECLPTGRNQGLIELVSDSRTFREIQSSYGLAGAFQDRPIAEWLQKYNPTGISYERAVENFTLSCAGYCVATYVLGICDRHNDNIMLRRTGHLFHIDFARFLGHAQMFGNIKRDRAPFVLTSDMAYVINGGDRPSSQFQEFVDICCRAFNIVRKQSHILINLLSLMLDCGIPELSGKSDLKYVYDALKPNASDKEATTMFTRLIDTSLSSSFTRLNFFIHNLAQMRFSGSGSEEERRSLSFAPELRPYREEEGLIVMATVVGYQKRYSPEKYYLYCVKIGREKTTTRTVESYVFRTFDEFEELHNKLAHACSASSLPSFPGSVIVGRSQVKNVAERRKAKLNSYLEALLKSKRNVAMHDLVYTFFHPILRDEEKEVRPSPRTPDVIGGEIKLSLHYKNSALYIMVIHCKNLSPVNGSDPDPYVKTYLLPDPSHTTKRKTKVARKTLHPTYNEMLIYRLSLSDVKRRTLKVAVWNYETLQENDFLGAICIDFSQVDVTTETTSWHKLSSSFS